MMLAAISLWKREMVRFYRQPSRVVGAVGSPLVFWLLIGSGLGRSFQTSGAPDEMTYLQFFYPGALLLILLFTSIFSTISLIEDRKEGFLQSVLVAPVSRLSIVLGKILGGTTLAMMQGLLFLILAPFAGITLDAGVVITLCCILFVTAFFLSALGFVLAWQFNSVQGFHAVMNLLLFPMWLLSGALFPSEGASRWIQAVMAVNPLSYGMQAIRTCLMHRSAAPAVIGPALLITGLFGVSFFLIAAWMTQARNARNLA